MDLLGLDWIYVSQVEGYRMIEAVLVIMKWDRGGDPRGHGCLEGVWWLATSSTLFRLKTELGVGVGRTSFLLTVKRTPYR